ncbi:hypothetical protein RND81_10G168600 [Saponaria officinalis]|uniref:Uncharacterized protein n=1 Tax=Saponaria officinalis TaxID=3572 RepID=A0AAW1I5I0_SAPOF
MAKTMQIIATVVIVAIFSLLCTAAVAADAPAPSPTSAAGALTPSVASGVAFSVAVFFFGYVLKI